MFTRELKVVGAIDRLLIEIDTPTPNSVGEILCNYRILEGSACYSSAAYGSDAIQSFVLALDGIRNILLSRYPSATWADLPIELAFPKHIPYFAGIKFYKDIEKYVDSQLQQMETKFSDNDPI
jgi:hypothetical protein